jgi:RNA 3'-terminal phosphate cyclase (ATP)
VGASGPGNVVIAEVGSEQLTEVLTGFGRQAVKAERVADEVVRQVREYLVAAVPVRPYLADQLLLPLGLSAWLSAHGTPHRRSSFRTVPLTRHAATHIDLLGISISVEPSPDGSTCVVHVGA